MPQFAIIGYGVVGRALGAVLAQKVKGSVVTAYDNAPRATPGRCTVAVSLRVALRGAGHVFICVPSHLGGKGVDGVMWRSLAKSIARHSEPDAIVVIKSTLVPGDAAEIEKHACRRVVVCPEFMSEGTAERDILAPSRVLVGGGDRDAVDSVVRIYGNWVPSSRIIRMDVWSAQLAKLLANAMLAQRVSSINSIALMCEKGGGNAGIISNSIGRDPRIGPLYLDVSAGFGGSCLEKDLRLLCCLATCMGLQDVAEYWQAVIDMNNSRIRRVAMAISRMAGRGGDVAIMGLAFKSGVADVRNSVSVRIARALAGRGHAVVGWDPRVGQVDGVPTRSGPYAAAEGAKCIAVLNDEPEFRKLDWRRVALKAPGAKAVVVNYGLRSIVSKAMPTTVLGMGGVS